MRIWDGCDTCSCYRGIWRIDTGVMRVLVLILKVILAGSLQAVAPTAPWLGSVRPPFLLALTVDEAMRGTPPWALVVGCIAGLIQDAMGLAPLGGAVLCYGVVALLCSRLRVDVFTSALLARAFVGAAATVTVMAGWGLLLSVAGYVSLELGQFIVRMIAAAILGALSTPFVALAAQWVDERLGLGSTSQAGISASRLTRMAP